MSWQDFERKLLRRYTTDVTLHGSKTWDPVATAATQGAEVNTTVTVTGAAVGDRVIVNHTSALGAAILVGAVTSPNTVTVRLVNTTAVAVDLATGTLNVTVIKTPVSGGLS